MFPWVAFISLIIGLIAIIKGADLFTDAAVWIAEKTGIPKVIIGVTIVSLATTLPEFAVSSYASFLGHSSMAVGNAVGSCICNIGLILGIVLMIKKFPIERNGFVYRGIFMIGAASLLYLVGTDLFISRLDGLLLLAVLVAFLFGTLKQLKASRFEARENQVEGAWGKKIGLFIVGACAVVLGSRMVVNSGITLAAYFDIPEGVIALTLIALGTSLPELVTSLTAALKGHEELSLGNIIGANILNLTWVVGGSALIRPLHISSGNLTIDFPVMGILMVILVLSGMLRKYIHKLEGIMIFSIYCVYIIYMTNLMLI